MLRSFLAPLGLVAVLTISGLASSPVQAGHGRDRNDTGSSGPRTWEYGQNSLFNNHYVPGVNGGLPAQMYVSPIPVPAHVGHTYITNEAVMPHELLYSHHRHYYRYTNEGRGLTRTSVSWHSPPFKNAGRTVLNAVKIAR